MTTGASMKSTLGVAPSSRSTQGARSKTPVLTFQAIGKIDDVAACFPSHRPGIASEIFIGGEKGEIHVLQVLGQHALDERRLFADSFQLTERLFVVEQANVLRREVAVAEHVLQLPALQGGSAYDGNAEQAAPMSSIAACCGGIVRFIFHQACEASS